MNYLNLNGKIIERKTSSLPVDNGAFRYGYGLFETMLVENGTIRLMQYHWERLFSGLKQLLFTLPVLMTPEFLEEEVRKTVEKNSVENLCLVRLQLFAGGGGLYSPDSNQPGYVIECFPLDADVLRINVNGLVVGIAEGLNKSADSLCNLKSCNALIYAMAARQARANRWNDALICNTYGNIIESTIANIFWVKNGVIHTPPLSEGCIAGVMRRYIIENTTVTEKSLSVTELLEADEVFLTNAIKRIRWVGHIEDRKLDCALSKEIFSSCFAGKY